MRLGFESIDRDCAMPPSAELTEAEQSVMEVLWQHEDGATVREIVLAVYGRHEHSLHGSVKSFLDRLMEKGFASVDKNAFAHRFFALITRQQFVGRQLKKLAESHFSGAVAPMLLSLVEQTNLSNRDRAAIEKIINGISE